MATLLHPHSLGWGQRVEPLARPTEKAVTRIQTAYDLRLGRTNFWGGHHNLSTSIRTAVRVPRAQVGARGSAGTAATASVRNVGRDRKVIVVGAGPSGALTALYLAAQGWQVVVHDTRPDPSTGVRGPGRDSYSLLLNRRALRAIAGAGVSQLPLDAVPIKGVVRHRKRGKAKVKDMLTDCVAIDQQALAAFLVAEGRSRFPDRIRYVFHSELQSADLEGHLATFAERHAISGGLAIDNSVAFMTAESFVFIVGADGINSKVRAEMAAQVPGFTVQQTPATAHFKLVNLPSATDLPGAGPDWGRRYHVWDESQPMSMVAPPVPEGGLRGALTAPLAGRRSLAEVQEVQGVQRLFSKHFPDAFAGAVPEVVAEAVFHAAPRVVGHTTLCSMFHGTVGEGNPASAVLVGDAGHSVEPTLSQGANLSLESAHALAEELLRADGVVGKALPAYSAARKPDTDAVARLSSSRPSFLHSLGAFLATLLSRLLPFLFKGPAMSQMPDPDVHYASIEKGRAQEARWGALTLVALLAAAVAAFLKKEVVKASLKGAWEGVLRLAA